MPDLDVLRQRVEDAERRLAAAQSSRESECQGLMNIWLQIRERFQAQEQEIAAYRVRLSALQDTNVQLTELIGSMLHQIEDNVSQAAEDAVPTIAEMAKELLEAEPGKGRARAPAGVPEDEIKEPTLGAIVDSEILNLEPLSEPMPFGASRGQAADLPERVRTRADDEETVADFVEIGDSDDPSMLDIPDLPAGIGPLAEQAETLDNEDHEIARELEEIELLRKELSGLRQRITTASAAE